MKVVINTCFGGFRLSAEAMQRLGRPDGDYWYYDHRRSDPDLVRVVEEMGEAANGRFARLRVVEVPDDVEWEIDEYDGTEHVAEKHRTWS